MEVIIKSRAGGKMTIEEKVSNIILETMKEQTDFCKKTALGNKATLAEQKAIFDQATQAILDLIESQENKILIRLLSQHTLKVLPMVKKKLSR